MFAHVCTPNDIRYLNQSKEYTLTATSILEKVLTDSRLTPQAAKLWQLLFSKSKYDSNISLEISYSTLGRQFGKSTRTIARWVKSLESIGYIQIRHNYDEQGGQHANTFYIRIPHDVYEHAMASKDRKSGYLTAVDSARNQIDNNVVNTVNHNESTDKVLIKCAITPENISSDVSSAISPQETNHIKQHDNSVRGGDDNSVLQKDINNIKEINNNVVVDQVKELEGIICSLENKVNNVNRELKNCANKKLIFEKLESIGQITCDIHFLNSRKAQLLAESNIQKECRHKEQTLSENIYHIANKTGDRVLPMSSFRRLGEGLQKLGYVGKELSRMVNEIVFEIRFGTLRKSQDNQQLTIEKAINIALKLVRENRWSTPIKILEFI